MSFDLLIVGSEGGTHVGGSLLRAGRELGIPTEFISLAEADSSVRLLRSLSSRFRDRRPPRFTRFNAILTERIRQARPRFLLTTGSASISAETLEVCRSVGTTTINFSTDDPFNAAHRAAWHLNALEAYDLVCTPRRANIDELSELGCRRVAYIQFAYDPELFFPQTAHDGAAGLADYANAVVFVGGADPDRVTFFSDFIGSGVPVVLHGGYWARYGRLRAWNRGLADPTRLRSLTAAAGVNICLVRRANRDDHVMRSFEIPAVGGFMIAEDTAGHRDIFGEEGQCVLYFKTAQEAAEKSYWALNHPEERRRMAIAAHELVIHGGHTYQDRLLAMLSAIPSQRTLFVAGQ